MLYGSDALRKEIMNDAFSYAQDNNLKLVYAAMVGSISQGLQYANSDYDTRFLYVREDFPQKICNPSEMGEADLVHRYYPKGKVYEWIPFWEITSFLRFVCSPRFKTEFSVGLYNIVGWTFQSPYTWDPYGLKSILVPMLHRAFNAEYKIAYHRSVLDKYRNDWYMEDIIAKSLLYSMHSAATIEWSLRYNEEPPVNIFSLLFGLGHKEIGKVVEKILIEARRKCKDEIENGKNELHASHFSVMTKMSPLLLPYLEENYQSACSKEIPSVNEKSVLDIVDSMEDLLEMTICSEQCMLG